MIVALTPFWFFRATKSWNVDRPGTKRRALAREISLWEKASNQCALGSTQMKTWKKAVASGLRSHGFTVFRTHEKGNSGKSDEEQLIFATSINAVLLTYNVQDFPRIHYEWVTTDKPIMLGLLLRDGFLLAKLSCKQQGLRQSYLLKLWKIDWNIWVIGRILFAQISSTPALHMR